jgi:hypothetical protein
LRKDKIIKLLITITPTSKLSTNKPPTMNTKREKTHFTFHSLLNISGITESKTRSELGIQMGNAYKAVMQALPERIKREGFWVNHYPVEFKPIANNIINDYLKKHPK